MKKSKPPRKPVLGDHEKQGKKLVPPLIAAVGPFSFVEWINHILPEVLWIGLLHESLGEVEGIDVAVALAQSAEKCAMAKPIPLFVGASHYRSLSEDAEVKVRSELEATGKLAALRRALLPLVQFYPTCPFKFLYTELPDSSKAENLALLKRVLRDLFDKKLRRSVMVQGTVVYIGFMLGRLKVRRGLALSHFPEIEKYLRQNSPRESPPLHF